jgi:SAM-dependent methyltransferase
MNTIECEGQSYPLFQSQGFAAQFAIPFAQHVCRGEGVDIGCGKKEWALPGAVPVDLTIRDQWSATNLPHDLDYIFSSHCLEHLQDWTGHLNYWTSKLRKGGTLFLYLPDFSQRYWRPWNNRKHVTAFAPEIIRAYMERLYEPCFVSGVDLNNSFMAMGEKR